ncbi:protoheme IX farnesyltransferase 2 [Brevibacillus reuszeri]|uniref:Protoheme IX farnesyltransferase n=2 Tax=Brevibacillus reuszeri TaxID=54915 RepID=A0A0K9YMB7_9BACL|nr:heme o synthase [Brevibacillus reuszeri]KNB69821.1 protoheme IX farnesyltransferase [Brevibacillus reuszeri]MED1858173.1 heme o synthase [Brevibacillus reuszeri]GED68835.1 protoheme IX farnesyltransferase 2 [Brevibacillus reuszeri]
MDQQVTMQESLNGDTSLQAQSVEPATWRDYVQLTKPGITLSNLMTTFAALWLASFGFPDWKLAFFTMLGTALVIMSGAALNNFYDRDLDKKMERTKNRALPAGRISARNALLIGIGLLLAGLAVLAVFANPLAAVWGLIGHIFYVLIYTPLKRVTTLNTVIGGISGAAPPVIGWVAVTNNMDPAAWLLFLVLFLWQPPHFLALAMLKTEEYRAGNLPMLPVVKGFAETKRQMMLWGSVLFPASILLFIHGSVGYVYLIVMGVMGLVYMVLLFQGFNAKDDLAWARKLFGYSILYLTVFCAAIVISTMVHYY